MPDRTDKSWPRVARCWLAAVVAILMLTVVGCEGCNSSSAPTAQSAEEAEAEKKRLAAEKKKKEPLEIQPLLSLLAQEPPPPVEGEPTPENAGPPLLVKPGHWTTTSQLMKANYDDFVGRSSTALVNTKQRLVPLENTNFTFQSTRPVALAKGIPKRIEGELFIPEQSQGKQINAKLFNRDTGGELPVGQPLLQKMPSYQYFLVVLAKEVTRYGFLKVSDSVRMPWEEELDDASLPHYRVSLADARKNLPLPNNMLTWSSVAYLIWDEVDPTKLSPEQQLALVDWLHWGGRLIINGPDSLDSLRGSFLDEYLPVDSAGQRSLLAADLEGWSAYWSRRDRGKRPPVLEPTKPWSGINLKPREGAKELVGGGKLFYEWAVGRGSVVVSSIQLAERDFINWPGYDSFLNAGLLRRPRRVFSEGPYDGARITWVDFPKRRLDAHFSTSVRLFARDAIAQANEQRIEETSQNLFGVADTTTTTKVDRPGGLGSWDDFNPVSKVARDVLTEAAAVRVPGGAFVLACLGFYLMVLVPLNWMVFRSLGRLEWAWIAAPIIALLGTLVIVRQAQLDIGFVRSQTEIALLELQGTHPRGLVSRYTALYSSLSTTYDMIYENPSTLAIPFSDGTSNRDEKIWDVVFEKHNETRLSGLAVSSASTKMVHSEQMLPLEGSLQITKSSRGHDQLQNRMGYDLRDVVVVRRYFEREGPAKYESSWIGELRNNDSSIIGIRPTSLNPESAPYAEERKQAAGSESLRSGVSVEELIKLAFQFPQGEDPLEQRRDEYRVVGLIDQVLPGTEVSPAASQVVGTTVVLAHLQYGDLPRPQPDVNSRTDVIKTKSVQE